MNKAPQHKQKGKYSRQKNAENNANIKREKKIGTTQIPKQNHNEDISQNKIE